MKNFLKIAPGSLIKAANFSTLSAIPRPQSVILLEQHGYGLSIEPLITKAFPELHKRFNFQKFLFEMCPSKTGLTVEKEIAKIYHGMYQRLCENSNFPSEMLQFANEKFGTKYDPYNVLKKDFMECGARLSRQDILEVVKKSFNKSASDEQKQNLQAHLIWTVISDRGIPALIQMITKTIGEDGCYPADTIVTGNAASLENIALRNISMANSIIRGLQSSRGVMGLFGLAHYDKDNSGIKNIIANIHRTPQTYDSELKDEEKRLKQTTTIHPEQIVFIHVFKGEPTDEFGASYRKEIRQSAADKFPLYPLDVTKMEAAEFVEKVGEIAKKHQEEFSKQASKKDASR